MEGTGHAEIFLMTNDPNNQMYEHKEFILFSILPSCLYVK